MPAYVALIALLAISLVQATSIQRLAWLQGCWRLTSPNGVVEENWTAPRAGSMLGVSRTLRADTLAEHEFVVLRETVTGLSYEAHPSGQPGATFSAREVTDSTVIFEDPTHDFPQRIGYRRVSGDSLLAWIEGTVQGNVRRIEFRYGRNTCPGP